MKIPVTFILFAAFTFFVSTAAFAQEVTWLSFNEAVALQENEENPKKIFIDVYTDWCGWCKKMDRDTFSNPAVSEYMNKNFYMVKLDAEQKEAIIYKGNTFKFIPSGRNGYHELASSLLQGELSFPTVVFLDEQQRMISPLPGYHPAEEFLNIAKYIGDDIFKEKDFETYSKSL